MGNDSSNFWDCLSVKGWLPSRNLSPTQIQSYQAEAEKLRKILGAGVSGISGDKQVTYDLIAVRKRLRDVMGILYPQRRPRISSVYLGGF